MYEFVLAIHNLVRWIALILGILAVVRAFMGWLGRNKWTPRDRQVGSFFAISMDIQFLLGLILYLFLSPLTRTALRDFGGAMQQADLRFFAIEHALIMILSLVFAHLGSSLSRKAAADETKFKRAALWFSLSVILILVGMPWARPLFPGL